MIDTDKNESIINPRHFWGITALIGCATTLQASLLWFTNNFLVATLPFYLQAAWALIALLLLPTFRRAGPLWPGLVYILLVACAPFALLVDGNSFAGNGYYNGFFRVYLLVAGIFVAYLCWRQTKHVPVTFVVVVADSCKGPRLAGKNSTDWLLRLVLAAYVSSLFAGVISIESGHIPENFPGFFAGLSPVVSLVLLTILSVGVFLRRKMLIAAGALANFVYLVLFISECTSPVAGAGFFDITLAGGWTGLAASIAFMLVLACDRYIGKTAPVQQLADNLPGTDSELAAFPLKWPETLIFTGISGAIVLAMFLNTPADERLRKAVHQGDLATVQQLVTEQPELAGKNLFEQAARGRNTAIVEFLADKVSQLDIISLDRTTVADLLQQHGVALAQRLAARGLDLSSPKNLRYLVSRTDSRYGKDNTGIMQALLQLRAERGQPLADFYLPENDIAQYRPYRFNNPLAIAIERGNPKVIKFLDDAGFRCDDEVLAASIVTADPAVNPLEYRLKITGEPTLSRPLAFELLAASLSESRADRYIRLGIDLTATDAEGNNLFHFLATSTAFGKSAEHILKRAAAAGCDINAINLEGKRPLWLAVEKNRTAAMTLLLKLGADRNICSPAGESIRDYCEKRGYITLLIHLD